MPASSRKRNKGKERKAKQLAKKEEYERTAARRFWRIYCDSSSHCDHGCEVVIPADNHPVSSFIDQFYTYLLFKKVPMDQVIRNTFVTQVWNNESYRNLIIDIFLRIGINELMFTEAGINQDMGWPSCVAQAIVALENYNVTDDIDLVLGKYSVVSKWRDLRFGGSSSSDSSRRDTLKFYRKRTSCKCLKKMHLEARKSTPKMGWCWNCKTNKERASLSVCSRCKLAYFCSRECLVAAWPVHKSDCDTYSRRKGEGYS